MYPRRIVLSEPSTPRILMPAVWVLAITVAAFAIVAGSSHVRAHRASTKPVAASPQPSAEQQGRVRATLEALPLAFEANQGQTDPQVKYMARGNGYTVFLTENDTVFALSSAHGGGLTAGKGGLDKASRVGATERETTAAAIHMKLVNGSAQPEVVAGSELPGVSNYFIGNDRTKWLQGVKHYATVSYHDVYPGVNMAFHGQQRQVEFDFVVAPEASVAPIRFGVSGAKRVSEDAAGNLVLSSAAGNVLLHKPVAYQEKDNTRQPVDSRFALMADNTIGFELGNYDHSRELVIDPSVTYATYLGGTAEDDGYGVAVDGSGNAYFTGQTMSTNFPTMGALHGTNAGGFDAFVTELSSTGSLIFSTYIGGTGNDSGNAIAVDASGDVFVAGGTTSLDFPTQGPFQATFGGVVDAFVLELSSTGSVLTYSTFLGGTGSDVATVLALDGSGDAYVVGSTTSTDYPIVTGALQATLSGASNGFVTKLNGIGNALVYSTYLGGGTGDFAVAVAVDSAKNAYVTGATKNKTFPTTAGVFQSSCGSDGNCNGGLYDAFVTVINAAGSGYVYSTFLGGESNDEGLGIAVDSAGDAYVTGFTSSSTKFPLKSPLQATLGGGSLPADAFVTELNPAGTALVYSTYLGGSGNDTGVAIAVDV